MPEPMLPGTLPWVAEPSLITPVSDSSFRRFGHLVSRAIADKQDTDMTMLSIDFSANPMTCPQCQRKYLHRGWLRRHIYKKRHFVPFGELVEEAAS